MHGIHTATLEVLPSGLLRVIVPTVISWTPGQHVFVRFLTPDWHLLTAHPFTISSAYQNPDETGKAPQLIFYIKPRGGVTGRLAALARKQPGISKRILIEGPYGGVSAQRIAHFDTVLVIGGGSGGGFSLAMIDEVLRQYDLQASTMTSTTPAQPRLRNLQVVFSTRDASMADWFTEEIESRFPRSTALPSDVKHGYETSVSVHISSNRHSTFSSSTLDSEETESGKMQPTETTTTGSFSLNVHRNSRPDISSLIARTVARANEQASFDGKPRVGILACGPASMLHDTRNAAAQAQMRVINGEIEELYMHSEPFA